MAAVTPSGAGDDRSPPPPHRHNVQHKWSLPFLKLWKKIKSRRTRQPMYGSRLHNFFGCFMRKRKKDKGKRVVEEYLIRSPYNSSSSTDLETSAHRGGGPVLTRSHHIRHLQRRSNSSDKKDLYKNREVGGPSHCPPKSIAQSSSQEEAPLQGRSRMLPYSEITEEVLQPDEITEEEEAPLQHHPRRLLQSEITEEVLQPDEITEEEAPLRPVLYGEITEEYQTNLRRSSWRYRSADFDWVYQADDID